MKKRKIWLGLLGAVCVLGLLRLPAMAADAKTVTGYAEDQNEVYTFTEKPTMEEVQQLLPDTLSVYLEGENGLTDIPVTWTCTEFAEDIVEYVFYPQWDETQYVLDSAYSAEGYQPVQEIIVGAAETKNAYSDGISAGQWNILQRAMQQANIAWTPVKDLEGYHNSTDETLEWYSAGTTYYGIPYGMPIDTSSYVPNNVSFQTFVDAMNNGNSKIYTARATHRGTYPKMHCVYYSSDCSAFVSYCYGLSRMSTATIAKSSSFSKVSGNNIQNAQIGDCVNYGYHHVRLITGIERDDSGAILSLTVTEQTPPRAKTGTYSAETVQDWMNNGYVLLRYKYRDSVGSPKTYSGYTEDSDVYHQTDLSDGNAFGGVRIDLTRCDVQIKADVAYDGTEKKPVTILTGTNSLPLVEGKDYTAVYQNNIERGTATVTITGKDRYFGTVSGSFVIRDENVTDFFGDVTMNDYYSSSVYWAVKNNITNGMDNGVFVPANSCTRAQAVTFLWRTAGTPAPTVTSCNFTDVSADGYYYNAVLWAVEQGIVKGTSETTFSPEKTVNRAEIVTMQYRRWQADSGTKTTEETISKANPFEDVIAETYYYDAVLWAVQNSITDGVTAKTFAPQDNCTRAQIVTLLYRQQTTGA